jgi:hypothetical protein
MPINNFFYINRGILLRDHAHQPTERVRCFPTQTESRQRVPIAIGAAVNHHSPINKQTFGKTFRTNPKSRRYEATASGLKAIAVLVLPRVIASARQHDKSEGIPRRAKFNTIGPLLRLATHPHVAAPAAWEWRHECRKFLCDIVSVSSLTRNKVRTSDLILQTSAWVIDSPCRPNQLECCRTCN